MLFPSVSFEICCALSSKAFISQPLQSPNVLPGAFYLTTSDSDTKQKLVQGHLTPKGTSYPFMQMHVAP